MKILRLAILFYLVIPALSHKEDSLTFTLGLGIDDHQNALDTNSRKGVQRD